MMLMMMSFVADDCRADGQGINQGCSLGFPPTDVWAVMERRRRRDVCDAAGRDRDTHLGVSEGLRPSGPRVWQVL